MKQQAIRIRYVGMAAALAALAGGCAQETSGTSRTDSTRVEGRAGTTAGATATGGTTARGTTAAAGTTRSAPAAGATAATGTTRTTTGAARTTSAAGGASTNAEVAGAAGRTEARSTGVRPARAGTTNAAGQPGAAARGPGAGAARVGGADSGRDARARSAPMVRDTMAFPTGNVSTSTIALERRVPREIQFGRPFAYELEVRNLTDITLHRVAVRDEVMNFSMDRAEPPAISGSAEQGMVWELGSLGPGEARTIEVLGSPSQAGRFTACASVTHATALCTAVEIVQPALQVRLSAPESVLACDPVPVRAVVTNTGTGAARDVRLAVDGARATRSGAEDLGTLEAGQSREVALELRPEQAGRLQVTARATGSGDLQAEAATATVAVRRPVLEVQAQATENGFIGREFTYTINVRNTGDAEARDLVLEQDLDPSVRIVSGPEGAGRGERAGGGRATRWNLGTLAPGQAREVRLRAISDTEGTVASTVRARAYCAEDTGATQLRTALVGIPAILVEVVDLTDPVEVGQETIYVITVTNQGNTPNRGIRVVCTLPEQLEFIGTEGPTRGALAGRDVRFEVLPEIAPNARVSWKLRVRAVGTGDIRFRTAVTTDRFSTPIDETEATTLYR